MSDTKQLTLPITGMTCANCVATVERNLKKMDGVQSAVVNLSSERATVDFDSAKLGLTDVIARVNRAGYGVATGEADLIIKRLSDDNDARRLEKALAKLEGVLEAQVTFTTEKARVKYVPTIVTQAELRRAVASAGFEAMELGGEAEDAEAKAREDEINEQRRLLIIGLIFTVPLFLLSMGKDFNLLPAFCLFRECDGWHARGAALVWLVDAGSGFARSVLRGLAILCGRVQGFAKQIREHGRADRDGFLCRVFLFTANYVWLADGTCLLRNCGGHHHADQTWKIFGSACQGTYLRSDQEIDGTARQNCPRHS